MSTTTINSKDAVGKGKEITKSGGGGRRDGGNSGSGSKNSGDDGKNRESADGVE
ncbi:unnamed protein product [Brassica rapa subsp. trilocularis]